MNINGIDVTENDYIELAKWANHLEKENTKLLQQVDELKANMLMIVNQRNSLNRRLEEMKQQVVLDNLNTIETVIVSDMDLTNPEQYRISEYKPKQKPN